MKFKLPLPRLPFNLGSLLARRRRGGFDQRSPAARLVARLSRLQLPPPFPTAVLLTVGIGIGIGLWLWLTADETLSERGGDQRLITVPVVGGVPSVPLPPPPKSTAHEPAKSKDGEHGTEQPPHGAEAAHGTETPTAGKHEPSGSHGEPSAAPSGPGPDESFPLTKAPAPGLFEDSRNGSLPIIASDGRQPWQVYARRYSSPVKTGRIAIVIGQMGVAGASTGLALQRLPPGVTLSFVPAPERIEGWVDTARGQGHEVLLSVPMEPLTYPHDDPGPHTLLLSLDSANNRDRLEWALGRFSGYVGITSPTGSKFGSDLNAMKSVLEIAKSRGLMFLDARTAPASVGAKLATELNVPHAHVDRLIDQDPSRAAIDSELRALETIALKDGSAVGMGEPYPTTVERIAKWVPLLADKHLMLVPLSAVVNLQASPDAPPPLPPAPSDHNATQGQHGKPSH